MTRGTLLDEIVGLRFDAIQRTSAASWLDQAYAWVYFGGDSNPPVKWSFRYPAEPVSLAVVLGNRQPTMPDDFGEVVELLDDHGDEVKEYTDPEFETTYRQAILANATSRPDGFKVVNRQIVLGPTPNSNYTFNLAYGRQLYHFDNVGAVTAGPFTDDADTPCWPAEHHGILVDAATIIGLSRENDPFGAPAIKAARDEAFQAMKQDLQIDLGRVDDVYPAWP